MARPLNVPLPRPSLDCGAERPVELDWRLLAACRSTDPDLFFPVSSKGKPVEDAAKAKAVCARCLVQRQCLAFALRTRQAHGIWGGLTEEERERRIPVRETERGAMKPSATA
jgi:WhiB family redox-sensing transcriptional regulator